MTLRSRFRSFTVALLVLLAAAAAIRQLRTAADRAIPELHRDSLPVLVQPDLIPGMTLGVPRTIAAVLWLRTTAQIGEWFFVRRMGEAQGRYLAAQIDAISRLDPFALMPFEYGTNILPAYFGAVSETHELALRFLNARTHEWRAYFALGYLYYRYYGQPERAAEWWRLAALLPGDVPPYLANLAQLVRLRATGKLDERLRQAMLEMTLVPEMEQEWRQMLQFETLQRSLRAGLRRFHAYTGRWPESVTAVVDAGIWPEPPVDPWGGVVRLSADGRNVLPSDRVPLFFKKFDDAITPPARLERGQLLNRWERAGVLAQRF